MTTLTLADSDGSLTTRWEEVGGNSDTPEGRHWCRQHSWEFVDRLAYQNGEILRVSEDVRETADTQVEFDRLAAEWKRETAHMSSPSEIAVHRAYLEIIGMGKATIPMILRDLRKTRSQWFLALSSIAREVPIRQSDRGDIEAMTRAWLRWGKQRQYI